MPSVLYNYRRCPYAMRARMALYISGIEYEKINIDFKNKPAEMLALSPKGTVPVLITVNKKVIDESLDVMHWALSQNDPEGWLADERISKELIQQNDEMFKPYLDMYKYPNRFEAVDAMTAREAGCAFLEKLNDKLQDHHYLIADSLRLADVALFPFIRQFANVDKIWFDGLPYHRLKEWLEMNVESDLFKAVMVKD